MNLQKVNPGVKTPGYFPPAFGLERLKNLSLGNFLSVPSARPTIARRFIGGSAGSQTNRVP
jgi:hypothetical protein